jgi:hypothetical protein
MATFAGVRLPDVIPDDQLDGLDAWREKLEATAGLGRWSSVAVGVERWLEACEGYLHADEAVLRAAEGMAAKKREIEGRLSARRAQIAALEARGAPHEDRLDELASAVTTALAKRPILLDEAGAALDSFEARVIDFGRKVR